MQTRKAFHGFMLLFALAAFGFLLVYIPPQIVAQYEAVSRLGNVWVYVYFGVVGLGGAIMLGCSLWILWQLTLRSRKKRTRRERRSKNPSELSREQQKHEIEENLAAIEELQRAQKDGELLQQELDPLVERFEAKRAAEKLEIVAFGTISSGKSSLLNALAGRNVFSTDARGGTTIQRNETPWPGNDKVVLVDTPGLGEVDGASHVAVSAAAAKDADLVLLTVDGPLRDSEFRLLERLGEMEKRVIVCLNKGDWYDEVDRDRLLAQLREQTHRFVPAENVLAVRAQTAIRQRRRVLPDGSECEESVEVEPDISPLAERMMQIIRSEGTNLLLANLLLQSRGMVEKAQQRVRESLDRRAREIVQRYMWGAGGAAAVSPFPVVDLVAGCAISSKMVVDLARVYRQEIDLNSAMHLIGQLGKNLIAILGVSAATPAVASVFASLLKTVPGVGTIAGGFLQGIVQALVTRWIGAVFIVYFRDELHQIEGGLAGEARRQWERLTTVDELRKLVVDARKKLDE